MARSDHEPVMPQNVSLHTWVQSGYGWVCSVCGGFHGTGSGGYTGMPDSGAKVNLVKRSAHVGGGYRILNKFYSCDEIQAVLVHVE